ncbi:LppU/SCO3897 family protein [Blastococcus sp. SYSU D00695]
MTTPGSNGPDQPGWGQPPAGPPGGWSPPPPPPGGPTPPPPGGFPQGQYPQQGGAPYPPQQGGAPYPPHQGASAFGAPQAKGTPKWLIPVIAGVVLVAAAVALFTFFGNGAPEVGDCLDSDSGDPEVVDCDDSSAVLRIIGEQDGEQTASEFQSDPNTCSEFSQTDFRLWYGDTSDSDAEGTVYCTEYVND